jgi:D-alanyl-D-alanine carboxypeptidase/D-alanyl-D-alanine-endopeptidase (penicillin-binding protein 4)
MNRDSRNVMASTLFKVCGARALGIGSWENGTEAIHRMAINRRLDPGPTRILDGSGLSLDNRISARLLCDVLRAFDTDPLRGPALFESLPTSGKTGTLRRRMASRRLVGRVHAKTGTLNDKRVRSLAGYIDGKGGKPGFVFAIVLNGRGASHGLIDQLVEDIAR